jgi:hypothetical protein
MLRLRYFRTLIKCFKGIRAFAYSQGKDGSYFKKKQIRAIGRRALYEWRCYNARSQRLTIIARQIQEKVAHRARLRLAFNKLAYFRIRAKEMKHDLILRDLLYSDHTVFINGQLVPIEGHEELSFMTVETMAIID